MHDISPHALLLLAGLAAFSILVVGVAVTRRVDDAGRADDGRAAVSGNAHYDGEFEIRSRDAGWAKTFFADVENRRLVRELFGLDASAVSLSGGTLAAYFREKADLGQGGPALSELAARIAARS
ncbi:MAG: hypothetical protein KGM24_07730 [Elusimicrobia bacterium]|nr:hypothetical protein [Elusimicrobiota bacterium]